MPSPYEPVSADARRADACRPRALAWLTVRDPLVNASFEAPRGWSGAHLQTLRSRLRPSLAPTDALASTRALRVPMDDGTPDALRVLVHTPRGAPAPAPAPQLVLLVHGLGGSADSTYMTATAAALLRAGIGAARLDLRGAGRHGTSTRQMYHAGRSSDVRVVLRALAATPQARPRGGTQSLGVMGFSLGGNVTLKLLGEPLEGLPVVAGVAVSAPLDLAAGAEYLHHVAFGGYERAMLRGLRADVARFAPDMSPQDAAAVAAARRIEQFDDAFTARRNGWRDAAEYYAVNSSAQYLPRIEVPTLVMHALDDPVVPAGPYRSIDWEGLADHGFVHRAVTAHGGHVGFHQRGTRVPWYAQRAVRFLTAELADTPG
jgi:predicted alpha/beta-fold hydrolase